MSGSPWGPYGIGCDISEQIGRGSRVARHSPELDIASAMSPTT
jgi:hypothetical protein